MNAIRLILLLLVFLVLHPSSAQERPPRISLGQSGDSMMVRLPWARQTNSWCVEATTDLRGWADLGELLEINGTGEFVDHLSHMHKRRYYRAIHKGRDIQAALDRNEAKWDRLGASDYDFTFRWLCFCVPDFVARVRIEVRADQIVSITRLEDGVVLEPSQHEHFPTVDALFDLLQDAIDREPHSMSVRFDPRTGVPRRGWIDYSSFIADEERGFIVEEFRIARSNVVQITETPPAEIQLDLFSLEGAVVRGNRLTVSFTHSGGCAEHDYELFMSPGAFLESFPVQANLYLRHNANGDQCRALIQKEITFDLTPIGELYGRPDPILLNVHDYFTDRPGDRIQVRWDRQRVPRVQITNAPPNELLLDPFWLDGAKMNGDILTLSLSASGGCREHTYQLFMSPDALLESNPPQAELFIRHNGNDDPCDAIVFSEVSFDMSPISRLHGQPGTIILNVNEFFSNRTQVNYEQ